MKSSMIVWLFTLVAAAVVSQGVARAQVTVRISVDNSGVEANAPSVVGSISDDGQIVAFSSTATNLDPQDTGLNTSDPYVYDRRTRTTSVLRGTTSDGTPLQGIWDPAVSGDGRYVACLARTITEYPVVTVAVFDRVTGQAVDVHRTPTGSQSSGPATQFPISMSANGRFVAFTSTAIDLTSGPPTPPGENLFVHDRQTGVTTMESFDPDGQPLAVALGGSGRAITSDGRFLVFESYTTSVSQVFVRDRATRQTSVVSLNPASSVTYGYSGTISDDGRYVAFAAGAPFAGGAYGAVYVRDLQASSTLVVSTSLSGAPVDGISVNPSISASGRFVAFDSLATNLVVGDTNGAPDVFLRDLVAGSTTRVSVDYFGREANAQSDTYDHVLLTGSTGSISPNGRFIVFRSFATNLVPNDRNGFPDVFVRDTDPCQLGTVNSGGGAIANVLFVNQSLGEVVAQLGLPVRVELMTSPAGPNPARCGLFVWRGLPANQFDVTLAQQRLGCTVNPTPAFPGTLPRVFLCLRGRFSPRFCGSAREARGPELAPWSVVTGFGFSRPVTFTLQGILEDNGAGNREGLSVTNSVELIVR